MTSVYGGSSLNIAASGAANGTFGCFHTRDHSLHCLVQIKTGAGVVHYRCVPHNIYNAFRDMPLMKRAWAFRERILPSRTVHFNSIQVFWECFEKVACETFPAQFPDCLKTLAYLKKGPVSRSMWKWIVDNYSRGDVTYATDKLVAISGLVREIQPQTQDSYIAGMWQRDLEIQLCWSTRHAQPLKRASQYRAPTWSWASLDGAISYNDMPVRSAGESDVTLFARVICSDLQFVGTDVLGQLSSANLRLRCNHLLHIAEVTERHVRASNRIVGVSTILDDRFYAQVHEAVTLPVFHRSVGCTTIFRGLLLEPTRQQKGQYRMLGTFFTSSQPTYEALEATFADRSCWVDDAELFVSRTDEAGAEEYVIDLI